MTIDENIRLALEKIDEADKALGNVEFNDLDSVISAQNEALRQLAKAIDALNAKVKP